MDASAHTAPRNARAEADRHAERSVELLISALRLSQDLLSDDTAANARKLADAMEAGISHAVAARRLFQGRGGIL